MMDAMPAGTSLSAAPTPPTGTRAIVDEAVEEAAQTIFSAADVPLARAGELLAAIQGPAMRAVMEMRIEQIVKHGHTAEGDRMLPISLLPDEARKMAAAACDLIVATGERRNLPVARKRLARAAALCMAAIDRLDVAMQGGQG